MSDLARPSQPVPLGDAPPTPEALIDRPSLRATGFLSLADIQRALAAAAVSPPPIAADEPAQGC